MGRRPFERLKRPKLADFYFDYNTVGLISVPFLENLLPKAVVEHFHYARQCSIIQARSRATSSLCRL